jgi:hypothetical protein
MGYSTEYEGQLKFTKELTASQIAYLNQFLGEDIRDHRDWGFEELVPNYFIDLKFTPNFDGLEFTGAEKSNCMEHTIGFLLAQMRSKYPSFGLTGDILAQGEDIDDRYRIEVRDYLVTKVPVVTKRRKVTCPECDHTFYIDEG